MSDRLRVAVCFSGHARSWRENAAGWLKLRLQHHVTFFACFWDQVEYRGPTWWRAPTVTADFTAADQADFRQVFSPALMAVRPTYTETADASRPYWWNNLKNMWSMVRLCHAMCANWSCIEAPFDLVVRARTDLKLNRFEIKPEVRIGEIVCTNRDPRHRPCCDAMFYGNMPAMELAVRFAFEVDHLPTAAEQIPEMAFYDHCRRLGLDFTRTVEIDVDITRVDGTLVPLTHK